MRLVILFAFLAGFSPPAQAEPVLLDDAGLIAAYSGATHLSFYRRHVEEYGGVYFEETYHPDGALDYRAGEVALTGFWQVANGRICFQYPESPLYAGCFVVAYDAGCYYSYQIGPDGEPFGLESGEWWIRAHVKGTKPDCAAADLVS